MNKVWVKITSALSKRSSREVSLICMALVGLIAGLDIISGAEISMSIFYLVPVSIATWYGGRRSGIIFGVISAVIWFLVDNYERN